MSTHEYQTLDVPVTGGTLRAAVWQPEGKPAGTVLAIHGITANHLAWSWLVRALPGWRVIAPDLRGRGGSNQLPGPYGMAAHADDLAALLAATDAGPVQVVGHSMGGFVALVLAHRHPELVQRLLLVDGGLPVQLPEGLTPEQAVAAVIGPAAERLAAEFPSVEAYLGFWKLHPAFAQNWNDDLEAYATYDLQGEPPHLKAATRVEAMTGDTEDMQTGTALLQALAEVQHPASFLSAERGIFDQPGGLYDPAWVAQCQENFPGLVTDEVHGINHYTIVMSDEGSERIAQAVTTG